MFFNYKLKYYETFDKCLTLSLGEKSSYAMILKKTQKAVEIFVNIRWCTLEQTLYNLNFKFNELVCHLQNIGQLFYNMIISELNYTYK